MIIVLWPCKHPPDGATNSLTPLPLPFDLQSRLTWSTFGSVFSALLSCARSTTPLTSGTRQSSRTQGWGDSLAMVIAMAPAVDIARRGSDGTLEAKSRCI